MIFKHTLSTILLSSVASWAFTAWADDPEVYTLSALMDDETISTDSIAPLDMETDSVPDFSQLLLMEQERLLQPLAIDSTINVSSSVMPMFYYLPTVYKPYRIDVAKDYSIPMPGSAAENKNLPAMSWIEQEIARHDAMDANLQNFCARYPWIVKLNLETLPEPPKHYVATVDPKSATIKIEEVVVNLSDANKEIGPLDIKPKHWLHSFQGSLHFSQAYNSPNWYQGGNNNLNLIGNFVWNVKLNPKFHPKLLFENTVQYKLAINSAPDDTLRNYSISEDLFQVNTKFGYKATHNWYYSVNMQFKTQLLQNHPTNSRSLTAAFLSPGELNIGLGMTYNRTSADKKCTVNVSIDPLSYNMICYRNTNVTAYKGKKITNQYGSKIECKLIWKPVYNISYTTRLFAFTNYEQLQGDWEHTLSFDINRFLSTQIYAHLRYDSATKQMEGTKWHRWQLKEILSFGFTYKFSSL